MNDSEDEQYKLNVDELEKFFEWVEEFPRMDSEKASELLKEYWKKKRRSRKNFEVWKGMKPDKRDEYKKILDQNDPIKTEVQSLYDDDWFPVFEEADKMYKKQAESIGRYPHGWRHYETYMNYRTVHKDATMEEYAAAMNKHCEFDEYLEIIRAAVMEEGNDPANRIEMARKYGYETPEDEDPEFSIGELINSQPFENDVRAHYEKKCQEKLLKK